MNSLQHFVISALAGSTYLFLIGSRVDLVSLMPWLVGGVLIDIDHLFTYSLKDRTINLKKVGRIIAKDYKQNNQHFYVFHTIEFALFFSFIVAKTFLGWQYLAAYLLHLSCDGWRHRRMKKNFSWLKKWSWYYNFLRK